MNLPDRVAAIRADYDHCFGCGTANPIGLQLDGFSLDGETVTASFTPRADYHGFSDLLHGGIVAAALDEVMAWTAILVDEVMVVTGTLELRYRKPARVETTFGLVGHLAERRGRRLRLRSTMSDGDTVVAEASGLFLAVHDLGDPALRPASPRSPEGADRRRGTQSRRQPARTPEGSSPGGDRGEVARGD